MIDVLEYRGFHITGADTPHGERAPVSSSRIVPCAGEAVRDAPLTGGMRGVLREVAQNLLEWMSSTVAASNKCTSRDRLLGRQPMRARTRDDSSARPADLKGTRVKVL